MAKVRVVANGPLGPAYFGWLDLDVTELRTSPKDPPTKTRTIDEGFNKPHRASPGFVWLRIKKGRYEIRTWWANGFEAALILKEGDYILFLDVESDTKLLDELISQGAYAGHRARALSKTVELEPLDVVAGQITPAMLSSIRASIPRAAAPATDSE